MSNEKNPKDTPTEERKEKKEVATKKAPAKHRVERERAQFRALILANPNYFGNIKVSPFKPVKAILSNTRYEEVKCVGFNPQFERLEAVVLIKQESGYSGDVCSNGTPEYVRFYLSFDNGATWQDEGMASFTAYDIPGEKPLEYAVTLQIDPAKKFCFTENMPKVRAILSWNNMPPPDTPDFTPVWGNVAEVRIQIDPLKLIVIGELLKAAKVKLPQNFEAMLDLAQPLIAAKPKALNMAELHALYKDKDVPEHRFLFAEVHKLIAKPELTEFLMVPGFKGLLPELDIDFPEIIGQLLETDGDTRYEELKCVGLNPNRDTLVGVLEVKLPYGYSGDLCSAGSQEYVAFWVDWGDGAGWTYAGTTSVNVHDISSIPPEGLQYAVFLPVDLTTRRQPCEDGPKTARVRAILSWQDPPPPGNPDHVPTWGNREETLIHIKPGSTVIPNTHPPFIETVGNMAVTSIDTTTGLANGPAVGAGFVAQDSPFGGEIVITGHIAYPPDVLGGGATPLKYRIYVSNDGGATWQRLTNKFTIWLTQLVDGVWSGPTPYKQQPDADEWYEYKEDLTTGPGNPQQFVAQNVLARWQTAGLSELWKIKIEAKDPANLGPTWTSNVVTVRLDNKAPDVSVTITSGAGPCGDFLIGDVISGDYEVSDEHFWKLWLSVQPALGGVFTSPSPLPRTYPTVPTSGETGTWSLDTTGMPRCGYVIHLEVRDRTIVNSGYKGFYNRAFVGFCLREPEGS